MWEIYTFGETKPYPALNNSEIVTYVCDGNTMKKPTGCHDEVFDMMTACWNFKPEDRPSIKDLLDKGLTIDREIRADNVSIL